jgi:tetratricopeptide (TPR) repeat protein
MVSVPLSRGHAQGPVAADPVTTETLATYRISSLGGLEMEVWLAGQRVGFTPTEVRLPKGHFRLTASGESLVPFIGRLSSEGAGEFNYTVPAAPLTIENYEVVSRDFTKMVIKEGDNPHLLIMALHMMTSAEEGRLLLAKADKAIPGDPIVDALRAKVLLKAGDPTAAIVASERAVRGMPKVAFCWRVHAEVLVALGDLDEALAACNQAVVQDPQGWRTLRVRAKVQEGLGNARASEIDGGRAQELYETLHRMVQKAADEQKRAKASGAPGVARP